ncbi:MAG: hypothetical protein HUU38_18195, partial [Anaerolineales bacterium]|nr:hypothetical protein [Anaerolineales bacterium]
MPFNHAQRLISRACMGILFALLVACTSQTALPTPTTLPTHTPTLLLPTMTPEPSATPTPTEVLTEVPTLFPTNPVPDPSGAWFPAPPVRHARAAHAVVSTGDAIYALAGTDDNRRPVIEVERFDGTTWTVETTLPGDGLNAPAAVFLDNRIYLIGGFKTTTNSPTDEVLLYDLNTQTWSNAAPLPNPRGGHAAVAFDGKIHVVGGGNSQRTLEDHSVYDPATDTWTDLAPLPRAKGSPSAVVFEGVLYVLGGRSGPNDFGETHRYNPETDSWEEGPAISPLGTAGAVDYCNTIYVFGGESQERDIALNEVLRLNLPHQVWELAPPMPTARAPPAGPTSPRPR